MFDSLTVALRSVGYEVVFDLDFLQRGDSLGHILRHLADVDAGLLVWSSEAAKSDWVRFEYAAMRGRMAQGMPLVVLGLDDTPSPFLRVPWASTVERVVKFLSTQPLPCPEPLSTILLVGDGDTRNLGVVLQLPQNAPDPSNLVVVGRPMHRHTRRLDGGGPAAELAFVHQEGAFAILSTRGTPSSALPLDIFSVTQGLSRHQSKKGILEQHLEEDDQSDPTERGMLRWTRGGSLWIAEGRSELQGLPATVRLRRALELLSRGLNPRTELRSLLWAVLDGSRWHRFVRAIDHTRALLGHEKRLAPDFSVFELDRSTCALLGPRWIVAALVVTMAMPTLHAGLAFGFAPLISPPTAEFVRALVLGNVAISVSSIILGRSTALSASLAISFIGGALVPWTLLGFFLTGALPNERVAGTLAGSLAAGVTLGIAVAIRYRDHDDRFHIPMKFSVYATEALALPVGLLASVVFIALSSSAAQRGGSALFLLPVILMAAVGTATALWPAWTSWRALFLLRPRRVAHDLVWAISLSSVLIFAPEGYSEQRGLWEGAWVGAIVGLMIGTVLAIGLAAMTRLRGGWWSSLAMLTGGLIATGVVVPMFEHLQFPNWIVATLTAGAIPAFSLSTIATRLRRSQRPR